MRARVVVGRGKEESPWSVTLDLIWGYSKRGREMKGEGIKSEKNTIILNRSKNENTNKQTTKQTDRQTIPPPRRTNETCCE